MRRALMVACLLGLLGLTRLSAQEKAFGDTLAPGSSEGSLSPLPDVELPSPAPAATEDATDPFMPPQWRTAWGLVGLRAIPAGPKVAPNGQLFHPNFSLDTNFNFWLWRTQGLYLYADAR